MSRRPVHIALGTIANKQGRVAGINLGGGYATFPGVVGTAVSKICEWEVARTGLQEREIKAIGLEYVTSKIESTTRADYYPDAGPITVKALAEKGSGRLLGGQIVGIEGAAKRIDIFATALHAGFTVGEMINLDLSYAPPFLPCLGSRTDCRSPGRPGREGGLLKRMEFRHDKPRGDRVFPGFFIARRCCLRPGFPQRASSRFPIFGGSTRLSARKGGITSAGGRPREIFPGSQAGSHRERAAARSRDRSSNRNALGRRRPR